MSKCTRRQHAVLLTLCTVAVLVALMGVVTWRQIQQDRRDQSLIVAIEADDVQAVTTALHSGANPNACVVNTDSVFSVMDVWNWIRHDQHSGQPILCEVADSGGSHSCQIMLALLNAGADVNGRSGYYRGTALMWAAGSGRTEIVSLLLAHKADPNLVDIRGETALFDASAYSNNDIVRLLRGAGARK